MRRHTIAPRPQWQRIVEEQGVVYPLTRHPDGVLRPYWDESAYYAFTLPEVEALEAVVEELHRLCLDAAAHMVAEDRFADLGITDRGLVARIVESWRRRDELPSLYGRFDLRYGGGAESGTAAESVKLLEYNADTPTSLVEAAAAQWFWLEDRFPSADQWNSLHDRLVARWREQAGLLPPGPVHFAHTQADEIGEDLMTVAYLRETAEQAGLETVALAVEDIGWDGLSERFVDEQLRFIRSCFKLYPWEWLATDAFGPHVLATLDNGGGTGSTCWIEPAWKMLLSNKALLAILWERNPGHPHLLPAYLDGPRELATGAGYVAKPLFGREGAGITVHEAVREPVPAVKPDGSAPEPPPAGSGAASAAPADSAEGTCYQQLAPLPVFDGNHVVLGAWVVGDEAAGLGIRESAGLVTDAYARFLPHIIV
ncbi:glutathionylspermidine synthase family protein [Streptomyces sp. NBC_01477]|uniref:glutathionylspermidine synthase family protein n=1 Tax=Streptomyces sp. NBC_01477 TaxID=2976015 RepID=UPI002E2F202D|nr:glutathionylspermidine synthase family protein [Streptomyces sp. NBC_01477]